MRTTPPSIGDRAARRRKFARRVVLALTLLAIPRLCASLTEASAGGTSPSPSMSLNPTPTPTPTPVPAADGSSPAPLTERERAMLELIRGLQERVTRLEAQVVAGAAEARAAEAHAATEAETLLPGRSAESPLPPSTAGVEVVTCNAL